MFDDESWDNGYRRGYHDGHNAGEHLGEQALRDRLLRRVELFGQDLRLGLPDVHTPIECLRMISLLIEDRRGDCHGSRD